MLIGDEIWIKSHPIEYYDKGFRFHLVDIREQYDGTYAIFTCNLCPEPNAVHSVGLSMCYKVDSSEKPTPPPTKMVREGVNPNKLKCLK